MSTRAARRRARRAAQCARAHSSAQALACTRTHSLTRSLALLAHRAARPQSIAARSFFYYAWKLVSTLAILGVAAFVTMQPGAGFWQKMAGALLVSLFWQQCGWLAHDFAHHQVFADRRWNDAGVLFVGNFLQAFSLEWWKNKHNTHHAIPNLHESQAEAHDGDPDIDTLPFLAWSQRFVEKTKAGGAAASPTARFFVRNQALLYFPVLFFARITWALSSIAYAFSLDVSLFGSEAEIVKGVQAKLAAAKATGGAAPLAAGGSAAPAAAIAVGSAGALRYPFWERVLLAGHYAWYLYLAFGPHNSLPAALAFFFVSQTFAGLLLAVAFGVGHNGMTVYDADARPGFAELQITTTRNVHDSWGNGWFMGGLHFQVEHHLFPFVPRHNLYKLRPVVEAMCKKHGVRYHATGLWQGNAEVLGSLDRIAQGLREFPGI